MAERLRWTDVSGTIVAHFESADGLTGTDLIARPPSMDVYRAVSGPTSLGSGRDPERQGCAPERMRRYSLVRADGDRAWYREVPV